MRLAKRLPPFCRAESFNCEVNGRCEAMLAKAAGIPRPHHCRLISVRLRLGLHRESMAPNNNFRRAFFEINIATVTKGFSTDRCRKIALDAFEKSGLQPLDPSNQRSDQSNQVRQRLTTESRIQVESSVYSGTITRVWIRFLSS